MKNKRRSRNKGKAANTPQQHAGRPQRADLILVVDGAPIHSLPVETISRILLLTVDPRNQWVGPTRLGAVCRRWREIVNETKDFWNHVAIHPEKWTSLHTASNHAYPCAELLSIILARASGSPIEVMISVDTEHYGWIFRALQAVLPDIRSLNIILRDVGKLVDLNSTISQLCLPSLEKLDLFLIERPDSSAMRSFLKCFLDIGARSKMTDGLNLNISCQADVIESCFLRHRVLSNARVIRLGVIGGAAFSLKSLHRPISLPKLRQLTFEYPDRILNHITAPEIRCFSTSYGGGQSGDLASLNSIAPRLEELTLKLRKGENQPLKHGCPTPFTNLKELTLQDILPQGSAPSLLLAPNLEDLELQSLSWQYQPMSMSSHFLRYILSPDGMLGPIHGLKRLRLSFIPLSEGKQTDYCAHYLRLHPHLESLSLTCCALPMDLLVLMVTPLSSSNDFLPKLKELSFFGCLPEVLPDIWFTQLATNRPQLSFTCQETPDHGGIQAPLALCH